MVETKELIPTDLDQEQEADAEAHQSFPALPSDGLGSETREELQIDFANGTKISLASLKYDVKALIGFAITIQKDMLNNDKTKQKGGTMIG